MKNTVKYTVALSDRSQESCTVEVPFAKTRISQRTIYAPNGYTIEGTEYRFEVSGVATADNVTDFRTLLYRMRSVLSRPRGYFQILWGETTADTAYYTFGPGTAAGSGLNADIAYGPLVENLEIEEIAGGLCAFYRWTITTVQKECFGSCGTGSNLSAPLSNILSNTVKTSIDIDQNFLMTRTVSGELKVKSSAGNADRFRQATDPGEIKNFKRTAKRFSLSADGLTLNYEYIDKEVHWTLPRPITTGQASFSIKQGGMGGIANCSLSGQFEAPSDVSKSEIISVIYVLLASKINPTAGDRGFTVWNDRTLTEQVYENVISFSFSWNEGVILDGESNVADIQRMGVQPPGSDGEPQQGGVFGGSQGADHTKVFAFPPSLSDACTSSGSVFVDWSNTTSTVSIDRPRYTTQDQPRTVPGEGPLRDYGDETTGGALAKASDAHKKAPYFAYHERMSWEVDNHVVVFVPASQGGDPIVQKTGATTVTLIQAGYAVRRGKREFFPAPNKPFYDKTAATMLRSTTEFENPTTLGTANQFQMTTRWCYTMVLKKNPGTSDAFLGSLKAPADPRTEETEKTPTAIPFETKTGYDLIVRRDTSS